MWERTFSSVITDEVALGIFTWVALKRRKPCTIVGLSNNHANDRFIIKEKGVQIAKHWQVNRF